MAFASIFVTGISWNSRQLLFRKVGTGKKYPPGGGDTLNGEAHLNLDRFQQPARGNVLESKIAETRSGGRIVLYAEAAYYPNSTYCSIPC
jgi:hypothetical protein